MTLRLMSRPLTRSVASSVAYTSNKENFTKVLLEEGLATVHAYSAEQSGHANEYFAAEERAKDARKGLWHD